MNTQQQGSLINSQVRTWHALSTQQPTWSAHHENLAQFKVTLLQGMIAQNLINAILHVPWITGL